MFGLRLKSIRLYVTLCFVLVILCAAGGKEGETKDVPKDGGKEEETKDVPKDGGKDGDSKDVPKDGGKEGETKDVPKDGGKDGDSKDVPKDDVKDKDPKDVAKKGATSKKSKVLINPDFSNKDQVTQLLESLSAEDIAKLENITQKEAEEKTAFLSPEEGCDFLGMGPLFDDPNYHKDLLYDYVSMERFNYWEMRCEEFAYKDTDDPNVKDTAAQKPSYCT